LAEAAGTNMAASKTKRLGFIAATKPSPVKASNTPAFAAYAEKPVVM
jgi:hypothetical protein